MQKKAVSIVVMLLIILSGILTTLPFVKGADNLLIYGYIRDSSTSNGIPNATVYVEDVWGYTASNATLTDGTGYYEVRVYAPWAGYLFRVTAFEGAHYSNTTDIYPSPGNYNLNMSLDPAPPRNSTIKGEVLDATDHSPIANASVVASSSDYVNWTTSGLLGHYSLDVLSNRTYTITAKADGYVKASTTRYITPGNNTVNFLLEPLNCVLKGYVRDKNGPVNNSRIKIYRPTGEEYDVYTDVSGYFQINLTRGIWQVEASEPAHFKNTLTVIMENNKVTWQNFTLLELPPGRATVHGFIFDYENGSALNNSLFYLQNENGTWSSMVRANSTGEINASSIPGNITVVAIASGHITEYTVMNLSAGGDYWQNFTLSRNAESATIRGRVVNASSGEGESGVHVIFTIGTYSNDTYTDGGGNYSMGVPAGKGKVLAVKDGFALKNATTLTSPSNTTYLNLSIEPLNFDNTVMGYITDRSTGKEIDRAIIYASNGLTWATGLGVDYRGYYHMRVPQNYSSLIVTVDGYRTERRDLYLGSNTNVWSNFSLEPVNFASGINGRLLDIQTGLSIKRVRISAYSEDRTWYSTTETDALGRFHFDTPSGRVILYFDTSANGYEDIGEMYFQLSPGEIRWLNLSFYPLPKDAGFLGYVRNSSSPLSNAVVTVRYGDMVRAAFTNATGYYDLYLPESRMDARVRAPGYKVQRLDDIPLRSGTDYWQNWTMAPSPAWFGGSPVDSVVDTDSDGLYNYLYVDVPVNVSVSGTYRIKGDLFEGHTSASRITTAINTTHLQRGVTTVRLSFRGELIRDSNTSGYFASLYLYDSRNGELLDETELYTAPHNSTEFDTPDAIIDPPIGEWVVDTDYDGLYNYLVFNLTFNASKGGNYTVMSALYDLNGNEVDTKLYYDTFAAGTTRIQISFPGARIYSNGADLWSVAFIITDDMVGEGDIYFFTILKYIYYDYRDFQHYPIRAKITGYVYDEHGTPIEGMDVMLYNVSTRYLNSTVTNSSGYYEIGGWSGNWLLVMDDVDADPSVYQGNLTQLSLSANETRWENRTLPFTPLDEYTENIVFHDWGNATVEKILLTTADNETVRFEMDVLKIGNGDGYLSESEAKIIRDMLLQQWNMPSSTRDGFTVDHTVYYLVNGTSTGDLGIAGPVTSHEPVYLRAKGNYSASPIPSHVPHYLELNCTYDNTNSESFTGNNLTAVYHISPPSGWGRTGNNTTINVSISGSDYIAADPGGDPVSGDGISWEWVNITINNAAPTTGAIKGNVTLQGASDNSGVTVRVYENSTGTEVAAGYTDTNGAYAIYGLSPGTYDIIASKQGYKSESSLGRTVAVGETLWIDFTLVSYPPTISHTPPPDALINESVSIYADVTDDCEVGAVFLYYMGVNASSYTQVTMERIGTSSTYMATIPAQNYPGFVHYYIWANDTAGNNASSPETGDYIIRIYETHPPQISDVQDSPDPAEYPEYVNISCVVTDMALYGVWLNVSYPSGSSTNVSMLYDSGTGRYYLNSTYPELGMYNYTIWANDTSGNWANASGNFTVQDTTKPRISNVSASPSSLEGPGIVNISAEITDASGISSAYVLIEGPSGIIGNFSMNLYSGNLYYYSRTYWETGTYNYTIWATDNHGLISGYSGNFTVSDTTPPLVSNLTISPSPVELGASVNISAEITDSYGISGAWINISLNGIFVGNFTMSNSGNNYWYIFTPSETGTANITIWAEDTHSLWNSSSSMFQVVDSQPPEIIGIDVSPQSPVELGRTVNITTQISDNSGIGNASMSITLDSSEIFNGSIEFSQTECWYEFLPLSTGNYTVVVRVMDTTGLWNSTTGHFEVVDTTAPEISELSVSPSPQEVFGYVNVSARITDFSGIHEVTISVTDPEGNTLGNYTMEALGEIYYYNTTYSMLGQYLFTIWAADNDGLTSHVEGTVEMVDTQPPVADAGNPVQAYSGETVTLDGSGSTDNYGIVNYTWTFDYNGQKVLYGEKVNYTFETPGNYTITLTVRDSSGNSDTDSIWVSVRATTGTIVGTVTDSNGNPMEGVRVYVEGTTIENYTDAGGRFTLSGVPPGAQTVIISFKGYESKKIEVTVTPGETLELGTISMHALGKGLGIPLWLIALLVMAILGAALLYVVAKKGKKEKTIIDEIFFIYKDGRLIKHFTRRLRPDMDQDILSGMLVAVQEFVKESFGDEGEALEEMKFGRFQIIIGKGEYVILAAVVIGEEVDPIKPQLKRCIKDIEEKYGDVLKDWDGDMDKIRGTYKYVMDLIDGKYE